ncbi:hypothetical protein CLF_101982 [Clonorchis sinensis]|uniref:Uncharacterized protein n=1 Tax=Clonorchis sinensis TaxID=79923 RepID=G7Y710_CLOSI|nr:hypothetical protein CLF_101982 [Clonorchis sinensis]
MARSPNIYADGSRKSGAATAEKSIPRKIGQKSGTLAGPAASRDMISRKVGPNSQRTNTNYRYADECGVGGKEVQMTLTSPDFFIRPSQLEAGDPCQYHRQPGEALTLRLRTDVTLQRGDEICKDSYRSMRRYLKPPQRNDGSPDWRRLGGATVERSRHSGVIEIERRSSWIGGILPQRFQVRIFTTYFGFLPERRHNFGGAHAKLGAPPQIVTFTELSRLVPPLFNLKFAVDKE